MNFRAGDVVLYKPLGEKWILAYAEGDDVSACGWPESINHVNDCELVKAATDEEYEDMLVSWAERPHHRDNGQLDYRSVVCKRQLAAWRKRKRS